MSDGFLNAVDTIYREAGINLKEEGRVREAVKTVKKLLKFNIMNFEDSLKFAEISEETYG